MNPARFHNALRILLSLGQHDLAAGGVIDRNWGSAGASDRDQVEAFMEDPVTEAVRMPDANFNRLVALVDSRQPAARSTTVEPDHTCDALTQAESFIASFEDDPLQEGVADILAGLRAAIPREQARPAMLAALKAVLHESTTDVAGISRDEALGLIATVVDVTRAAIAKAEASAVEESDEQFESRMEKADAADMLRLIDWIADKIGLPHDEELSQINFAAWLADMQGTTRVMLVALTGAAETPLEGEACGDAPDGIQSWDEEGLRSRLSQIIEAARTVIASAAPPAPIATNRPGDQAAIYAEEHGVDYATALVRCNMD